MANLYTISSKLFMNIETPNDNPNDVKWVGVLTVIRVSEKYYTHCNPFLDSNNNLFLQ